MGMVGDWGCGCRLRLLSSRTECSEGPVLRGCARDWGGCGGWREWGRREL